MLTNVHFEDSFGRLFGPNISMDDTADEFFAAFYRRFLEDEGIAKLFANTDMARQIKMLKASLFQLVSFYVTGQVSAELERIAQIHRKVHVRADMFDFWLEALVDTVQEFDEQADERTKLAWAWALSPGITFMRLQLGERVEG